MPTTVRTDLPCQVRYAERPDPAHTPCSDLFVSRPALEVECTFPGDLDRLFYRVDVEFEGPPDLRIRDPRPDFARVLRSKIEQHDRPVDLGPDTRLQAPDGPHPILNGKACAPRTRGRGAAVPGLGLEIDDVGH